jgi:glucuronoxylan 4-O-methyltransferase
MLVFGLGYDSPFWCRVNALGRTVFLEDSESWYERICSIHPEIEAYKVSYPGNITQWEDLLEKPERLAMDLPEELSGTDWNVILVDGPQGNTFSQEIPGRMSSIYEASRLAAKNSWVFVHDAERVVEDTYSLHYLGRENFLEKVRGHALMLIYRF